MTDLTQSPLAAADIEDIFQLDPATLPEAEFDRLVSEVRRRRSEFHSAEAAKQATPKAKRAKAEPESKLAPAAAKIDKPAGELTMDDLI
jgi:hypothetical protein